MTILFDPNKIIKTKRKGFKFKLYKGDLSNNLLTLLKKMGLDFEEIKAVKKQVKKYQEKLELQAEDGGRKEPIKDVLNDYKQAENLIDNILVFNELKEVRKKYKKKKAVWLPSRSKTPRHEHMAYYGKIFEVEKGVDGHGLLPGDDYNCQCRMFIFEDDEEVKEWLIKK